MATQINAKQTKAQPKKITLMAVYGYMAHPYTHETFYPDRLTTMHEIDAWTQAQLDAGKLVHGTD